MDLTVTVAGIEQLARRTPRAPQIIAEEMRRGVDRTLLQGEGAAKRLAPVVTGNLRRSIARESARSAGLVVTGRYGTNAPYARYVEEGRGPVVARGRALRFVIDGRVLYRKRVGPARARPFLKPSLQAIRPVLRREMQAAMQRAARRILGGP